MSTATATTRTPHALQAGWAPGALWIAGALAELAMIALALFGSLALGRSIEDPAISWWLLIGVATMALLSFGGAKAMRAAHMRVPGGLRVYGAGELRQMPTIVPRVVLSAGRGVVVLAAGGWALGHRVPGDYGITVGSVAVLAVVVALSSVWRVVSAAASRDRSWKSSFAIEIPEAVAAGILVTMALGADRGSAMVGLSLGGCVALVCAAFGLIARSASGAGGMAEELDALAEDVLKRRNPAPTLDERHRVRLLGRVFAGVVIALLALMLLWALFQ